MKCLKCKKEHNGVFGSGKYCSVGCSKSRIKTDDVKRKTSSSMKKAYNDGRARRPILTTEQIKETIEKCKKTWKTKLLEEQFSSLTFERLRKRVIIEQDDKCNRCNLNEWLGKFLTLELEHKDGDNQNNKRENLEALCPNCHSLTSTWRGRNKEQKRRTFLTEEQLVVAYLETGNIRQCLIKLGLAAKGANYGRVKRALTRWKVEY